MRHHQTIAGEESAGASPPATSIKTSSPVGVCCVGSRVTPTMEATSGGGEVAEAGKLLSNGDIYIGEFAGNAPHGRGKCIWIDGCVYDGEWRKGKADGRGNLSWPSGATYDGEFKKGRMEGYGAFVNANGETYHGSWIENRKDGYGKKWYANGDFYEGGWRWDVQEGHGRYVWRNGIQYVGDWRDGMISGRGVLVLANGDLRDGKWERGVLKRSGIFGSRNCSCYLGRWIRDLKNQIDGVSYSASSDSRKSVDGDFAGICMGESDGEAGEEDGSEFGEVGEVDGHKKPWQTISKGHKNYELVLSLQLGIRYSVGKPCSKEPMKLWPSDFDPREKFWSRFPPEGSGITRPHHSSELMWKDYCPKVFRHLRKLFDVDPADYVEAFCGTDSLRELSSPGKSGSLFFLTGDDRFIIKTVKKGEVKILIKMLLNYYQHVCKYENSLLTKFYGVHCVKPIGGHKVRFIVMGNLFCSEYEIHRRFDLKGSSHGRTIHKSEEEVDETSTLKDLDLNFVFHLQKPWFKNVMWQIERDCEFLEAEGIMDYSLLIGFHSSDDLSASKMESYSTSQQLSSTHGSFQGQGPLTEFSFPESRREALIRLGANMPARAEHVFHGSNSEHFSFAGRSLMKSPPSEKIYKCILYFGIIDILRDYNFSKKLEHAYKSLQVNPISISVVDPKLYSRRFRDFMGRVFVEDD